MNIQTDSRCLVKTWICFYLIVVITTDEFRYSTFKKNQLNIWVCHTFAWLVHGRSCGAHKIIILWFNELSIMRYHNFNWKNRILHNMLHLRTTPCWIQYPTGLTICFAPCKFDFMGFVFYELLLNRREVGELKWKMEVMNHVAHSL